MANLTLVNDEVLNEISYSDKKYETITVNIDQIVTLSPEALNKLYLCSVLNTEITIRINRKLENEYASDVKVNLKFAGFKGISIKEEEDFFVIKGRNKSGSNENNKAEESLKINNWNVGTNEIDLVAESDLVNPNDVYEKFSKKSDCITKPKPCKGCNCGRAAENKSTENLPKSDCGKCYLGDAFRCEGCPYRGLPAFEPGQKIMFNSNQDTLKEATEKEEIKISSKGTKVKIDL